jgi:hypothetical protein
VAQDKDDSLSFEVDRRLEDLFGENEESPDPGKSERKVEVSPLWDLKAIILSIDWEITDEIMTRLTEQIARSKNAYKDNRTIFLFLQLIDSVGKYIKANKADTHPDAVKLLNSIYTSLEKVALTKGMPSAEKEKTLLFEVKRFKRLKEQIALRKGEQIQREEAPPAPSKEAVQKEEMAYSMPTPESISVEVDLERSKSPGEEAVTEIGLEGSDKFLPQDDLEPRILREESDMMLAVNDQNGLLADGKDQMTEPESIGIAPHEAFTYALEEIKRVIKAEFEALRAELKLWRKGQ